MQTFSFRAECLPDVEAFFEVLKEAGVVSELETHGADGFPDVCVQIRAEASLAQLRELMLEVVDGHVMVETLRAVPLDQNSLERDLDQSA